MWVFDKLVAVAITGDDDDVIAVVSALGGEGGDDVVGLITGLVDNRYR